MSRTTLTAIVAALALGAAWIEAAQAQPSKYDTNYENPKCLDALKKAREQK